MSALNINHSKLLKITYLVLLGINVLTLIRSVLAVVGINIIGGPLSSLITVVGLAVFILCLAAAFLKDKFPAFERGHYIYILAVTFVFFILGMVLMSIALMLPMVLIAVCGLLITAANLFFLFVGWNALQHGRTITVDNIQSEARSALARA